MGLIYFLLYNHCGEAIRPKRKTFIPRPAFRCRRELLDLLLREADPTTFSESIQPLQTIFSDASIPELVLLDDGDAVLLDAEDLVLLDAGEPVLPDAEELVLLHCLSRSDQVYIYKRLLTPLYANFAQ